MNSLWLAWLYLRRRRVAASVMVGERDLQRRIDRFRTGVAEKDMVEVIRGNAGDAPGQFIGRRMAKGEMGNVVDLIQDTGHCLAYFRSAMAGGHAKKA